MIAIAWLMACRSEPEEPAAIEPDPPMLEVQGSHVLDRRTGLLWDRFVQQRFFTHEEAATACASSGARLPTRAELLAMRDPRDDDACQLPSIFLGARCLTIQCGSDVPGRPGAHWGVGMSGGGLVMVPAGVPSAMLCVKGP